MKLPSHECNRTWSNGATRQQNITCTNGLMAPSHYLNPFWLDHQQGPLAFIWSHYRRKVCIFYNKIVVGLTSMALGWPFRHIVLYMKSYVCHIAITCQNWTGLAQLMLSSSGTLWHDYKHWTNIPMTSVIWDKPTISGDAMNEGTKRVASDWPSRHWEKLCTELRSGHCRMCGTPPQAAICKMEDNCTVDPLYNTTNHLQHSHENLHNSLFCEFIVWSISCSSHCYIIPSRHMM